MKEHIKRVVDERAELESKINALTAFIMTSPIFQAFQVEKQFLMSEQLDAMRWYLECLDARLSLEGVA